MPEDLTAGNGTAGAGEAAEDNTGNRNTGSKEGASGGRYTGGGTGKEGGNELPGTRETAVLPESGASKDKEDENGEDSGGEKETASGAGTKGTEAGKTASGWKSFWYGVLCQAADIFLSAPTPFKAWLHDKMGFRDSVSVLFEKEVYEADLSGGNYTIQEEGSPFALINNAVKASTGKELSSEAYRQVSYVNDISFSNEQVLMERAVNGSLGESVTGYSYGLWRESYSVEADAGTRVSVGMETGSGIYYYTGTGSVANLVTESGTKGYSYGLGGSVTVYGQGSMESRTNTQAGSYGYNGEYTHGSLGLQYLRARYLKMETGTFTSRDAYAGRVQDIISQNRYTYAENNPVTFADPSGHKKIGAIIGSAFSNVAGTIGNTTSSTKNQVNTKNPNKQNGVVANSTSNNIQTTKQINESKKDIIAQGGGSNNFIHTSAQTGETPLQSGGMFYQIATQWAESVAAYAARMKCETYDYCQNPTQKNILHIKYCDWKRHMMPLVGKNGEPQAGAEIAFNDNFVKQPFKTSIIDRIKELPNWQDYPIIWSYIGYEFKYDWTRTIPGRSSCVDIEFLREVVKISHKLGIDPDDLMAVMAFESNGFDTKAKNPGSTARGLIQIVEDNAIKLGTTPEELENMSGMEQLEYVYRFYEPNAGKMQNLGDLYMVTLWPSGLGENDSYVLFRMGSNEYEKNDKLDADHNGEITRGEALQAVLDRRKDYEW